MKHIIFGLFENSKLAGEAISNLKEKGYGDSISVIAKDEKTGDLSSHQIKENVKDGATAGAVTGAVMGTLVGIIAGLMSVSIPGAGLFLVGGPLFASAAAGATAGTLTGGVVGALVDAGIPQERARMYEHQIHAGQVLVAVTVGSEKAGEVVTVLNDFGVQEMQDLHITD